MSIVFCASFIKNLVGRSFCNELVSRKETFTFMTDCAKNIIILFPERSGESFLVSFTKLSGFLKKMLTKGSDGARHMSQFCFEGLIPIDVRKPLFEVVNVELF